MKSKLNSVLVTGASTGIGAACALRLATRGVRVFAGVRNKTDGAALCAHNAAMITPLIIDVTDAASIATATQYLTEALGNNGLDGLVNNAGIAVAAPLEVLPLDALRRQFDVNVFGALAMTQACLPLLRQSHGRIVNIGSIAGRIALPIIGAYSMSKFALRAMTHAMRLELDAAGIDVTVIEPGAIATPIWKKSGDAANVMEATLAHAALPYYRKHLESFRAITEEAERHAVSADAVARAVEHALTAKRPRPYYLVGRDARLRAALAAILPQSALDTVHRWALKVPRRR